MARQRAELTNALHIFWLKKYGYLDRNLTYKTGGIKWGDGSSMGFTVKKYSTDMPEEKSIINLYYMHTDGRTGIKESINYNIELAITLCNYGGKRYWFICPQCSRRAGVIYIVGKWFSCRHCGNIAYQAQFEGGKFRVGSICEQDVEKAEKEVKAEYYKGKPTKRYKRYLRMREKMDVSWIRGAKKLGIKF